MSSAFCFFREKITGQETELSKLENEVLSLISDLNLQKQEYDNLNAKNLAINKSLKEQIELNEAFSAQALAVIQEAGLDPDTVNVNGGAIAMGHPLGCTGAKLTIQLLNEMKRRNQKYGMVTACVGGGQGIAGIFERL